jgi:hypothetical protein
MSVLSKKMYCYFIIWGAGMSKKNELFTEIYDDPDFNILTVLEHKPKSIKDFIKGVYSYEYLPFSHHETKFNHLNDTTTDVVIIFAVNNNPQAVYWGDPTRKFIHSNKIKEFKVRIREEYDPRINGKLTHEHVIHASDNETQVHLFLKYLGINEGLEHFRVKKNSVLSVPWFIPKFNNFTIKSVQLSNLYANILEGTKDKYIKVITPIEKTPHYKYLHNDTKPYKEYLANFSNGSLLAGPTYWEFCLKKFTSLSQSFDYLKSPFEHTFILVKETQPNQFVIVDGLHRATILKSKNHEQCTVAIIK